MRKETYFTQNRFFLLASLILSLIIPALSFEIQYSYSVIQDIPVTEIVINAVGKTTDISSGITTANVLFFIYLTGVILLSLRFLFRLMIFYATFHVNNYSYINGHKVYISNNNQPAFSFLRTIVLPKDIIDSDKYDKILRHEAVHKDQLHSIDIIIIELITIFTWFNPVIYLYKRSITLVHEYLADNNVLEEGYNKNEYQKLLLAQCFNTEISAISNNFNQKITKNRFIMMSKIKSSAISKYKILVALPVIFVAFNMFSFNNKQENNPRKNNDINYINIHKFQDKLTSSLNKPIKFPEIVKYNEHITVFMHFIIKDGNTSFKFKKLSGKDKIQRVRNMNTGMSETRTKPGKIDVPEDKLDEVKSYFKNELLKRLKSNKVVKEIAKENNDGLYILRFTIKKI